MPGLSESTLINNYRGKIRTILRDGRIGASIPFPLELARFVVLSGMPKPRTRLAAYYAALKRVSQAGIAPRLVG